MCDKINTDEKIMKSWKERIQNKYKQLYSSNKQTNISQALTFRYESEDFKDNFKVHIDKTYHLIDDYPSNFEGRIYIAAFSVSNIIIRPFLEYLLVKNPQNHIEEPNKLYFPYFESSLDTNIEEESNILLKQIFTKSKHIVEYLGYCKVNNDCYLVFDTGSRRNKVSKKLKNSFWWWTTISEIVDFKQIYNFPIDKSVQELFFYESGLSRLVNLKGRILENPIIGYQFENCEDINKNVLFGASRFQIKDRGLFIVFTQFERANKLAYLGFNYPLIDINNEPKIKINNNDYFIMRFALFLGNSLLISNEEFENKTTSEYNQIMKKINTLIIDYPVNNEDNNDSVFLIKDDSRCYFMDYTGLLNDNLNIYKEIQSDLQSELSIKQSDIHLDESIYNDIKDNKSVSYESESDFDAVIIS